MNTLRKQDAYPFLKGPTLADFMFIVVEHFLPDLDNLVAHILDLCHSLHRNTKKRQSELSCVLYCITFST